MTTSTVCLNVTIRNSACEVEVTLTGGDDPKVTALTILEGNIALDIQTVFLLMGQEEWLDFVDEAIDARDRHAYTREFPAVSPIGRSLNDGR